MSPSEKNAIPSEDGTMMKSRPKSKGSDAKRLPAFRSDAEFIRFVETHDLADYWDSFREVKDPIELDPRLARAIDRRSRRKQLISIRLENWQIRLAKATASREKIPYHTVIRRWIDEGIRKRRATS
jgi:predicted DNA binding CopG/RHH family protein